MIRTEPIGNMRCQWGESPLWWHGLLYFVDIQGMRIHCYDPISGNEKHWDIGKLVYTIAPRESGGFLLAGEGGFFFFDEITGQLTPIANPEEKEPDNRFNDGKCSPDGKFFAGTISLIKKIGAAKLYCLNPDLTYHEAFGPVTNSNGLAWSPDGKTLYYIDTPRREILAFDYEQGHLHNLRTAFSTGHIEASPDGMTVDSTGNLWIAFCHGGCISCFNPSNGNELRRIPLPCLETTSCTFGGPHLSELYVTTGVRKNTKEVHGGRLFLISGLGVKGLPANAFEG